MKLSETQEKHLKHPFYKESDDFREDIRIGQILYGAGKYPEPFNPDSWSASELLRHAAQEDVDKWHYTYGLYQKIVALEKALDFYAQAENYVSPSYDQLGRYDGSIVDRDGGKKAREALGYSEED